MIINHNITAMTICRNMNHHEALAAKAMLRISSGKRINSAADDPAGLCISVGMKSQILGLQQAQRNVQDGISALQIADGGLNETHSILQRMRELAVQAANGTYSPAERKNIQLEMNQLTSSINGIANNTEFNTMKLLNGNAPKYNGTGTGIAIQIGANAGQQSYITLDDMTAKAIKISGQADGTVKSKDGTVTAKYTSIDPNNSKEGVTDGNNDKVIEYALDLTDPDNASAAIKIIDDAINQVSSTRAGFGATQNMLEARSDYLSSTEEILNAAESRIEDADIAKEMLEYAKESMLTQVCQALLGKVNKEKDGIVEFLKSM